jgi:hypothetical protein
MEMEGERLQRLHDFLKESFHPAEFRRLLTFGGLSDISVSVNTNLGEEQFFFDVIEALDHRSLIDDEFFLRLTKERPKKTAEIEALRESWKGRIQKLHDFLKESFPTAELERFLEFQGFALVAGVRKTDVGADKYCYAIIDVLNGRNLIEPEFFDPLAWIPTEGKTANRLAIRTITS